MNFKKYALIFAFVVLVVVFSENHYVIRKTLGWDEFEREYNVEIAIALIAFIFYFALGSIVYLCSRKRIYNIWIVALPNLLLYFIYVCIGFYDQFIATLGLYFYMPLSLVVNVLLLIFILSKYKK